MGLCDSLPAGLCDAVALWCTYLGVTGPCCPPDLLSRDSHSGRLRACWGGERARSSGSVCWDLSDTCIHVVSAILEWIARRGLCDDSCLSHHSCTDRSRFTPRKGPAAYAATAWRSRVCQRPSRAGAARTSQRVALLYRRAAVSRQLGARSSEACIARPLSVHPARFGRVLPAPLVRRRV